MLLTKKNLLQRDKYKAAQPKRSGNLHERMKLLRKLAEDRHDGTDDDFWNALDDLETEVSMYDPAEPPFGERVEPKQVTAEWPRRTVAEEASDGQD